MATRTAQLLIAEKCTEPTIESSYVKLLGFQALVESNVSTRRSGIRPNSFVDTIGYNNEFYYKLEQMSRNGTFGFEVGLGIIVDIDGSPHLQRMMPLIHQYSQSVYSYNHDLMMFDPVPDEFFAVKSFTSSDWRHYFLQDNCLLSSHNIDQPYSFRIDKDSLVGRDGLDNLDSLPMNQLYKNSHFSYSVKKCITDHARQLVLRTSQVDVKKVKTSQVLFKPSLKALEQIGTVYYNKDLGKLQVYDGDNWRTISYENTE